MEEICLEYTDLLTVQVQKHTLSQANDGKYGVTVSTYCKTCAER